MFGKKVPDNPATTSSADDSSSKKNKDKAANKDLSAPAPLKPLSRKGANGSSRPIVSTKSNVRQPSRSLPEIPTPSSHRMDRPRNSDLDPNCLVIGRGICIKGEITACEKLIVEGVVDLTLPNAHSIEVSPSGHFKGTAEVAEADISGQFEGELVALNQLIVRATGHIKGKIRYGRIVIESGGEVIGDLQALENPDD